MNKHVLKIQLQYIQYRPAGRNQLVKTPLIAAVVEIYIITYTKSIRRYEAGIWRTSK